MMYHQYHLEINVTCCTFSFFTRERERERENQSHDCSLVITGNDIERSAAEM